MVAFMFAHHTYNCRMDWCSYLLWILHSGKRKACAEQVILGKSDWMRLIEILIFGLIEIYLHRKPPFKEFVLKEVRVSFLNWEHAGCMCHCFEDCWESNTFWSCLEPTRDSWLRCLYKYFEKYKFVCVHVGQGYSFCWQEQFFLTFWHSMCTERSQIMVEWQMSLQFLKNISMWEYWIRITE